jgi:7-dehydrocholesterol reductase
MRAKTWGREDDATFLVGAITGAIMISVPFFVVFAYITIADFNGSIVDSLHGLLEDLPSHLPHWNTSVSLGYLGWFLTQVLLYLYLPGPKGYGQPTPAGHTLKYNVNGFRAYVLSIAVFVGGGRLGLWQLSVIADHWGSLLVITEICGLSLTLFAAIKARYFPTHPEDRKFTGRLLYDIFMGVELNPRIGDLDLKLFCNGRPGIIAWTLINISYAAAQFNRYGKVTNSMILVNFLHIVYVADFFWNEDWYLRTIDIAHDHFGFMLAWGDLVWLPYMYTLQGFYLVQNPVDLSPLALAAILALGLGGYAIFRLANHQKDYFRQKIRTDADVIIWGHTAKFVEATYSTLDGKTHKTKFLASGFWGLAHHFNYVGDLMISSAYCLCCGFRDLLPYFYIIYMTILLVHRSIRDNSRCRAKYGKDWEAYCKLVPYKIVPYIF